MIVRIARPDGTSEVELEPLPDADRSRRFRAPGLGVVASTPSGWVARYLDGEPDSLPQYTRADAIRKLLDHAERVPEPAEDAGPLGWLASPTPMVRAQLGPSGVVRKTPFAELERRPDLAGKIRLITQDRQLVPMTVQAIRSGALEGVSAGSRVRVSAESIASRDIVVLLGADPHMLPTEPGAIIAWGDSRAELTDERTWMLWRAGSNRRARVSTGALAVEIAQSKWRVLA